MLSDDEMKDILSSLPEHPDIVQAGVDMAIQQEYIKMASTLDAEPDSDGVIDEQGRLLLEQTASIDDKKKALIHLAQTGRVMASRLIEQFLEQAGAQLHDWATVALWECRMMADVVWADGEDIGIVITGLGAEGHRLRYFVVLRPIEPGGITSSDHALIAQAFAEVCESLDSRLEEAQIYPTHARLKILVPMDVAVGAVIGGGIEACNQSKQFLATGYFVTNDRIPTDEDIQAFVDGLL